MTRVTGGDLRRDDVPRARCPSGARGDAPPGGTPLAASSWKQLAYQPHNEFVGVIFTGEIRALSASGTINAYVREY